MNEEERRQALLERQRRAEQEAEEVAFRRIYIFV